MTELPQGLSYSVALGKNYIPEEKPTPVDPIPTDPIQTELIDTKTYIFRFVDAMTDMPIQNGLIFVRLNDAYIEENLRYYTTDANGCIRMTMNKDCEKIHISTFDNKTGFKGYQGLSSQTLYLKDYQENSMLTYRLKPREDKYIPRLPSLDTTVQTTGPDVEISDETCDIFGAKMDFELNFGRGIKYQQSYDQVSETVKVVFSTEGKLMDYDEIEHEFKDVRRKSLLEELNKLEELNSMDTVGYTYGTQVKYAIKGFMKLNNKRELMEGGVMVTIAGSGSLEHRPAAAVGLVYSRWTMALTAEGTCKLVYLDGNISMEGRVKIEPALTIAVGVGWSVAHVEAGVSGKLSGEITIPWKNARESLSISATGELYGEARFAFVGGKKAISGTWNIWPGDTFRKSGGGSRSLSINGIPSVNLASDSLTVMSRDYLAPSQNISSAGSASVHNPQSTDLSAGTASAFTAPDSFRYSEVSADSGVFQENNVQYVRLADGTELLAWVHDFGDKGDTNRTTLVYSVNRNDGKGWSGITSVCSDTSTGDYYPMMLAEGNKAYLVWNKASEVFGDVVDLDYVCSHMDVYLSVFENGAFSEPVRVSDADNGLMEFSPKVAVNGEEMAVSWLVNSENDYHYSKGKNALYVREYKGGSWGGTVAYAEDLNYVSDYDLGYVDGKAVVAYAEDADNVAETKDGTVHYVSGGVNRTVGDSSYNGAIVDLCGDVLYFSGNGELYKASGSGFSDISGMGIPTDNFMVVKNANGGEAVTFLAQDGFTSNLYISYCRDGSYTSPVPMIADGTRVTHYTPVYYTDGTVSIAYNEDEVLADAGSAAGAYPFGMTDMAVKRKIEPDVFYISDVLSYDAYNLRPGNTLEFVTAACNYTAKPVTALQATLKGSVSGTVYEGRIDADIPVGESRYISVPYTLPDAIVNEHYTLTLAPADFEDRDLSDNSATCELGYSDIALVDCKIENQVITGTVKNIGYKTAENVTLAIREDSQEQEPFAELVCEKGSLGVGESWAFSQAVDAVVFESPYDVKYYLLSAGTDSTQNTYANDSVIVHCEPVAATEISLDNASLTMKEKTSVKLTATVAPVEAAFKDVVYTSNDNSVIVVDGEGNVYAVGAGTATVTAYTADCSYSAQCKITVEAQETGMVQYTLSDRGLALKAGDTAVLSLSDAGGTAVEDAIWHSADEAVVTVDETGKVTAVGEGLTLVTVGKDNFADACIVRVKDYAIRQLCNDKSSLEIATGETAQLEITIVPENTDMDKALTYVSADEAVATVSAEGLVTAVAEGRTVITVTSVNGVKTEIPVTVSAPVIYTVKFDAAGGAPVESVDVTAHRVVTEEDGLYSQEYIGYLGSVPTTSKAGYAFKGWYADREGNGESLSTETPIKEGVTYYACWEEIAYTVTLEQESISLYLGESVQLKAVITPADGTEAVYSTEDQNIITISGTGLVTAVGIGTATVNVTAGNAVAQCQVTVMERTDSVDSDVLPGDMPADGVIPDGLWIAGVDNKGYTYTGKAIKPIVRVYDGGVRLRAGKDYTISYRDNIRAAQSTDTKAPTIMVRGKGNYSGTEKQTFTIKKKDISDTNVMKTFTDAYVLQKGGKNPPLAFKAKHNGKALKKNKDYILKVKDISNREASSYGAAGSYTLTVTGSGMNYTGTCNFTFEVLDKTPVSRLKINKLAAVTYDGTAKRPELVVKLGRTVLEKDRDYTLDYLDNVEVGTATVIIAGKGDYFGTRSVTFPITGRQMRKVKITGFRGNVVYTGAPVYQKDAALTYDGTALREGVDYTVTYTNHLNVGKVSVSYTGIGAYTGTVKKTFKITPYNMASDSQNRIALGTSAITVSYSKGGAEPDVALYDGKKLLVRGKDYTLSYKNNNAVTTASAARKPTITIRGKGNYSGTFSRKKDFTITAKHLSEVKLVAADVTAGTKAGKYGSIPVLTDTNGRKLKAGTDYGKVYHYTYRDGAIVTNSGKEVHRKAGETVDAGDVIPAGTVLCVSVDAREGGNYTGTTEPAEYRVVQASVSKAKITVKNPKMDGKNLFSYTGKPVQIDKGNLTVKVGKDVLTASQYEILEDTYTNNVNKGTATVQIRGVGDCYGGTATVKFKIGTKGFWWFWRLPGQK